MKPVPVAPGVHLLPFELSQAYLYEAPSGLVLIDTSIAGSGEQIRAALGALGFSGADLREVIITHYHDDHRGALAEVIAWSDPVVVAHAADAPVIRGEAEQPDPENLADWERELQASVASRVPPAPAARVDLALTGDGDLASGVRVVHIPGHTPGSIAVHIPGLELLFSGDNVASVNGDPVLGPFNLDRRQAWRSFQRIGELDPEIVCPGHGAPITDGAGQRIREVVAEWERARNDERSRRSGSAHRLR